MRVALLFLTAVLGDLDMKNINEWELEKQYMADEEMLDEDLPEHEREKKPIDVENIDMSDPITVVAETKKGQVLGVKHLRYKNAFISVTSVLSYYNAKHLTLIRQVEHTVVSLCVIILVTKRSSGRRVDEFLSKTCK